MIVLLVVKRNQIKAEGESEGGICFKEKASETFATTALQLLKNNSNADRKRRGQKEAILHRVQSKRSVITQK